MAFFSICIPNYNYEKYLGETLESVLHQTDSDLEILVSDNCSTDGSVQLIKQYQQKDSRIKVRENKCNVGFSGNLDKAASMASGEWRMLLSSDDLLNVQCIQIYKSIIDWFDEESSRVILSSGQDVIDSQGKKYNYIGVDWKLWSGAKRDEKLSALAEADVWVIEAENLLRNSLVYLRTPFAFASTAYSKVLYEAVEGYSQGGLFNPDKKFAWAILGHATKAVFIDKPLVAYRVHNQNQESQQNKSGALKRLTDQYVSTFQVDNLLLKKAGLSREELEKCFIEQDVILRGLYLLADGNRQMVKRMILFGKATYHSHLKRNNKFWALIILSNLGPLGVLIAKRLRKSFLSKWQRQNQKV